MDKKDAKELLEFVIESIQVVKKRMKSVQSIDDLLDTEEGQEKLDSILMRMQAIGEAIKNLDKRYSDLLNNEKDSSYWSEIIKMREMISHHYLNIDAEIVFNTIRSGELDELKSHIDHIIQRELFSSQKSIF
ncbi:MAG: HepT-like ribonuclease domain-containing protein [Campylobacterota bacterium]